MTTKHTDLVRRLDEVVLRLGDLDLESEADTVREALTLLRRQTMSRTSGETADASTETIDLAERLETLLQETRDRRWLTSAGALEEAISRLHRLDRLQQAAEPLAEIPEVRYGPLSGASAAPDDLLVCATLGKFRSLARSLRASRGGEAEPPRSPTPSPSPEPAPVTSNQEAVVAALARVQCILDNNGYPKESEDIYAAVHMLYQQSTEISRLAAANALLAEHGASPPASSTETSPYPVIRDLEGLIQRLLNLGMNEEAVRVRRAVVALGELITETSRRAAADAVPTETTGDRSPSGLGIRTEALVGNLQKSAQIARHREITSVAFHIEAAVRAIHELQAEIARLSLPAEQPTVDVLKMRTSAGSDYYVRIRCGGREATPYRFRDRYPAEYEAAHLAWLLGLRPDEPDLMSYDEATYPSDPATRDRVTEFQNALRKSFEEEMAHMQVLLARALTERLRAEEKCSEAQLELATLRKTRTDG